jgi:hypothetical protein
MKKSYIFIIVGIMLSFGVIASIWESILSFNAPSSVQQCDALNMTVLAWASGYNESTAIYIKPASGSNWTSLCLFPKTFINGNKTFNCAPIISQDPGNYTLRASINKEACGSWTPTPNVTSCGDYKDRSLRVNSSNLC